MTGKQIFCYKRVLVEALIKEVTNGRCPYRHRVCDGLCNNCGILANYENTPTKIIPSSRPCLCDYDDLDAVEDRIVKDDYF